MTYSVARCALRGALADSDLLQRRGEFAVLGFGFECEITFEIVTPDRKYFEIHKFSLRAPFLPALLIIWIGTRKLFWISFSKHDCSIPIFILE